MDLQSFDEKCLNMLGALPNWHSRHYFRSAINHLTLGERLYPIDSNMGVFRYITAEEEAASGLMKCLIEKGYNNADKLKPKSHAHKHAVIPFFSAICQFIEDYFRKFEITTDLEMVDEEGENKIGLVVQMVANSQKTIFIPDPPLSFSLRFEDKRFSYKPQLEAFASAKGAQDVIKHIQAAANFRNTLLYATPNGYPSKVEVENPKFFLAYQSRVFSMLRTYLMIAPYKEKLTFVQDSLDAFLSMLNHIKLDDIHCEL